MQGRQQQQHGVESHHDGYAFSSEASEHTSCRACRGDAAIRRPGSFRIETFRDQRPEARQQQRGDAGEMEVDDNRNQSARAEINPLEAMSHSTHGKPRRDDGERRESGEKAREDRNERDAERCGRKDHEGERRGRPCGEKGRVTESL